MHRSDVCGVIEAGHCLPVAAVVILHCYVLLMLTKDLQKFQQHLHTLTTGVMGVTKSPTDGEH